MDSDEHVEEIGKVDKEFLRWQGFLSALLEPDVEVEVRDSDREAIWKKNKATLWYYPSPNKRYKTPLFLIYSLVNKAFVLDLVPNESVIKSFSEIGFDVYLLDFGIPSYEDRNMTLDDYIVDYIQRGVRRALYHSQAESISVVGYCFGGTLAAIYAAIAKEPIENLILMVAPIEIGDFPRFNQWVKAFRENEVNFDAFFDIYGVIPGRFMKNGIRLITSPVYYSPYLSLLNRAYDPNYVRRWKAFNKWTNEHIPFPAETMKQLINEFVKKNSLVKGELFIRGEQVLLSNIKANLMVVSSKYDRLVPKEQTTPILDLVSSEDKSYTLLEGGHTYLVAKGNELPDYLAEWLPSRSRPL